ncbi:MAG TPA: GMC family oxidoreductase [Chitinophagaceae bacterium]|nr:GMC family oxidoreductase [Chitinophagaceae bacterium]
MNSFDAIVVGSGISGGWAAKELCEKGLKTLMLERGKNVEHITDYNTANKHPWEFPHRSTMTREEKETYPIQTRHYSIREDNKHFYILDKENPYTEVQRYDWIRGDVLGGRSLLWARMSFRWSDLDFEANAKDGHGVDWPIRYKDIAPWYDYVERFAGISGSRENLPHLPDSQFQAPMPMNCVEEHIKKELEKNYTDRKLIHPRTANLTQQLPGRSPCQYRNLCHRGCPFGAYFSTQSSTLPAAQKTGNLTLKTGMIVNRIIFDEETRKAKGVEVIDRETNKTYEYFAKIIFLNASTVGTTFLLLNSKSKSFPNGLGNNNDVVGRYLMDHHKSGGVSADVEGFEDKYYFGRRPSGVYIPRFRNVHKQETDFLRGWGAQGSASRGRGRGEGIGADLKNAMTEAGKWTFGFGAFGECLPYKENRITLNETAKDKWGRPTLTIDASFKDNEKKMQEDMVEQLKEMAEKMGGKNVRHNGVMSYPGNANHEMGTARMGHDPKTSVLNRWNQVHDVKNVFITDGACMTSTACVNPSLTYMALTARAVDFAVGELRKGNI